ncbi:MAG TPA: ribonuclease J [Hyphomonadaceae bacterium]|nr:ribonuclease J [Hyphomonadaceae bacterium]HPN06909.1 ribonuclease J [Hyphomonadaceae bacterium]
MKDAELIFAPLGGCREIGMNLNAYGYGPPDDRRWIIVDVGVTFGDDSTPGVDLIMPDPVYLESFADQIEAIILTHAHEDHIGAIGWLWPRLRAPIYATPFTAYLVAEKLRERGLEGQAELRVMQLQETRQFGPFEVELVTLTHSIPEPNGLAIRTPLGLILHTGDWKIDPDPIIGEDFDQAKIEQLGREGILAIVCDSTNVFEEGEAGSEGMAREALKRAVAEQTGKVAITSFASNVARLQSCCEAARANDRSVCLVGRSMLRIVAAAQSVGLLKGFQFIDPEDAADLPAQHVLYLCTGSQGEPNAALARIARGDHPSVKLGEDDTVIFSSRVIPGNERAIGEIQNTLAERNIKLVTARQFDIHVSGHPCRDELRRMYMWARPQIAVPVHGERRHIMEHARFAKSLQVPEAIAPDNGHIIKLAPGPVELIDEVPVGRLHVDGEVLTSDKAGGMWERRKIAYNGHLTVSVVIAKGKVEDGPIIVGRGFSEPDGRPADESMESIDDAAEAALANLKRGDFGDDEKIEKALVRAVRRAAENQFGKRPLIDVTIHRV